MKKLFFFLMLLGCQICRGQVNTNVVIISGANSGENGAYTWNPGIPAYKNNTNTEELIAIGPGTWQLSSDFQSTNFPYTWYPISGGGFGLSPTGTYLTTNTPSSLLWSVSMTNFWSVPGDSVIFGADGRNMATTSSESGLEVLIDGNLVYTSTFTAGNGKPFSLDGHFSWDGTNLYSSAMMASGDPSNVQYAQFYQYNTYPIGTNIFQLLSLNNTNGLLIQSASISASRTPPGSYLPATNTVIAPGSFSLQ